jgi:pilus assembly protein CpaB
MALLMLALGCGLVASIGITQVMAKRDPKPQAAVEMQSIFVAAKDISPGDRLTAAEVKLESWPKDKVPAGALSKTEDIDGVRAKYKVFEGEPIIEKKLLAKGATMNDDVVIPAGYRVVPIKVDDVSGGPGLIKPGDRVDVLVHLKRNSQEIRETATRTLLENIKVFAVNDVVTNEPDKDGKTTKKLAAQTISLLATPAEAAKITLATQIGSVRLVMRPLDEPTAAKNATASIKDVLGGSQSNDADKEKIGSDKPKDKPKNSIADMLNSMKNQMKANVPPQPVGESFVMRLIQPTSIQEFHLKADVGPDRHKLPQNGWYLESTNVVNADNGGGGRNSKSSKSNSPRISPPANFPAPNAPNSAATLTDPTPDPTSPEPTPPEPSIDQPTSNSPDLPVDFPAEPNETKKPIDLNIKTQTNSNSIHAQQGDSAPTEE